jgi:D-sedoheptulose 7-phosphate isomerase
MEQCMKERERLSAMMEDGITLRRHVATDMAPLVFQAVDLCEAALRRGGKLFFCGNGGSAADAQQLNCWCGSDLGLSGLLGPPLR